MIPGIDISKHNTLSAGTLSGAQKTIILVAAIAGMTAAVLEVLARIP